MNEIKLRFLAGDDIDQASRAASRLARANKCRVRFDFNGISLFATPKKSPVTIGWEYRQSADPYSGRRPFFAKGQSEQERDEAEIKSRQEAIDQWMTLLPTMLLSGLDNTIGWLSNFLQLANRVGTKVNYTMLIKLFEDQGYRTREFARKKRSFYQIKENLGHYIIGQALASWKTYGSVSEMLCDFCADYERLRAAERN